MVFAPSFEQLADVATGVVVVFYRSDEVEMNATVNAGLRETERSNLRTENSHRTFERA